MAQQLSDRPMRSLRQVAAKSQPASERMGGWFFLPDVLFSLMIIGTLFVNLGPGNIGPIDGLLLAITIIYIPAVLRFRNPLLTRAWWTVGVPGLGFLMVGLVLLITVGGTPLTLLKDAASFAYLFVGLALLLLTKRRPSLRLPKLTLVAATYALLAATIMDADVRGSGTFANPNLTGSWFAAAFVTMLVLRYPKRWYWRTLALSAAGYGVMLSSSMGAMAAVVVAVIFMTAMALGLPVWGQTIAAVAGVGAAYTLLPLLAALTPYTLTTGLNRFERSSEGRLDLWAAAWDAWLDSPMGLGPGGFSQSRIVVLKVNGAETHNDYLGSLVDLGFLGLILWLVVLIGLFRLSGRARIVVVFFAALSLSHSAINYRHIWIFLALALAADYWGRTGAGAHPAGVGWQSERATNRRPESDPVGHGRAPSLT